MTQGSNKRSITLDLKQERGRTILKQLVKDADIMVENYRPGAFPALGIGYEDMKKINPRLIYCSMTAFGQDGPRGSQTAYDHAIQALELVETLREAAVSVLEVYLSAQNQRLNAVMKVLTMIATVFIPLTFIASIYGMNFDYMPELRWRYGYAFALGLMAVTAGLMIAYFRRRGWW